MFKRLCTLLAALVAMPAVAQEEFKAASDSVRQLVPDIKIDAIRPAPMEGFVEMQLGAQLVYVSRDGKYLIDGQVIEVATRKNLTEAARGEVRSRMLHDVTQDERVVFPATSDRRFKLTVFTDIDCGYCRRLHQEMAQYNELGIEIDYMFFPRAGIPSNSYSKAVSVWCADNRNVALTEAKAGMDPEPRDCPNPVEMHFNLGKQLGVTGTPALLTEDGSLIPGYVPPATLLARLQAMDATN